MNQTEKFEARRGDGNLRRYEAFVSSLRDPLMIQYIRLSEPYSSAVLTCTFTGIGHTSNRELVINLVYDLQSGMLAVPVFWIARESSAVFMPYVGFVANLSRSMVRCKKLFSHTIQHIVCPLTGRFG